MIIDDDIGLGAMWLVVVIVRSEVAQCHYREWAGAVRPGPSHTSHSRSAGRRIDHGRVETRTGALYNDQIT